MIKILFLIEGLSGGGAEKVLRNLVNNMDQSKFQITVQTINRENPKEYLSDGIHYKSINRCKTKLGQKVFNYLFRICAEKKMAYNLWIKGDYDIEVAYLETISTKLIAQSTNKKARKIAWVHCDLLKKEGFTDCADKIKRQYECFDEVVCVSEDVKTAFNKLFGNICPSIVLNNVIDEDEIFIKSNQGLERPLPDTKTNLLAIGRLMPQKNYPHMLHMCAQLKQEKINFYLTILGEGEERQLLERQIQESDLQDCVELRGFCANPYPYIKEADIVICSSLYEGLSTVILEALILGKAIVTTPCAGMKELLGDSMFGLIADETEDGLYNSLKRMLNNKDLRAYYEKLAKERSYEFYKRTIVSRTEDFFVSMMN